MKRIRIFLIALAFVGFIAGCATAQSTVEYLSPLRPEFHINANGQDHWTLVEPFKFVVDDKKWEAPVGFWTDFASVPRIVWNIISPYELGVGPIPHDFFYRTHVVEKAYADLVLLACMKKDGIPFWKRQSAYYAVSWFGQHAWDSHSAPDTEILKKSEEGIRRGTVGEMSTQAIQWQNTVRELTSEAK